MTPEEIEALMDEYTSSDDEGDDSEFDDELDEGFDDPYIQRARGGKDFTSDEFKRVPKSAKVDMTNYRDDSITTGKYINNQFKDIDDLLKKHFGDDFDFNDSDDDDDMMYEDDSQICECGGNMTEGECTECGKSYMDEGIYDVDDLDDSNEFDYVEEGLLGDEGDEETNYLATEPDKEACDSHRKLFGPNHERTKKFCQGIMNERLSGKQRNIDKNKNGKIDAEDFKLLRGKKTETKEGKPDFLDLDKDGDKKEPMKKAAKEAKEGDDKKEEKEEKETKGLTAKQKKLPAALQASILKRQKK
jgi:hypothetical protein